MRPIIFLDIDGVLNGHERHANGYYGLRPDCIGHFNRIIGYCDPDIVLSSAWRYMVLEGSMNCIGFLNLLMTHGVSRCRIVGHTDYDKSLDRSCRGQLIRKKLTELDPDGERKYVVLDNDDLGISKEGLVFIQTDDFVGLTAERADEVIRILRT